MSQLQVRLGKVIRRERKSLGIGQERFAHDIGVHRTTMSKCEQGRFDVALSTLERIAEGLGISASELLRQAEAEGRRKKMP